MIVLVIPWVLFDSDFIKDSCAENDDKQEIAKSAWNQTYGGTGMERAYAILQTADGGFILAGFTLITDADMWLVKTDENGLEQWNQTYGGGWGGDLARSLIQTTDGGFALAGYTYSYGAGGSDMWLVKTDMNGLPQWNQTYGGIRFDSAFALLQTLDGGFVLAGETESYGVGWSDIWLVKTDRNGFPQWNHTYGGVSSDRALALLQTTDEGFVLAGETESYGAGRTDMWLVKTDRDGIMQWNQTYGGTYNDIAFALLQTRDDCFVLAGNTGSYNALGKDMWLVKTSRNGEVLWNYTYGGVGWDSASSIYQTVDGGFALAGETRSYGAGDADMWLLKTDEKGIEQWNQTYGGTNRDAAFSVIQIADGGFALAGATSSWGTGELDMWLVKIPSIPQSSPSNMPFGLIILFGIGLLLSFLLLYQKTK